MKRHWSEADHAYLRDAAATGRDARSLAKHFGVSLSALEQRARLLGVKLHRQRQPLAERYGEAPVPLGDGRLSPELQQEIAAIKAERATAPRYKLRHW
jgi:hypothetical protein